MRVTRGRETGAVTVFMVLSATALLLLLGLVADGGGRLRALGRAQHVAAEAARAAANAIDVRHGSVVIDRPAARAAAQAYLRESSSAGTVTFTGPRTVQVTATVTGTYLIFSLGGHGDYQVSGTAAATAELVTGDAG
jgi:Flp pilus assembly protein TadG